MNTIFAVTLLLISSSWASELNRSKKQINFGSDDEKQGYFYDKPSISFDLPTQKPSTTYVASTTNAPVPTGYNYPKPSIAFEENPKPILIGGDGQTSVTTTFNKYEFNNPRVEIETQKPSSFGIFGTGVQKTTSQSTFGSKDTSIGIGGSGQTSFVSTASKFDYNKPKIEVVQTKPQSTFGSFSSGVQKTSSQTTFGSVKPSVGISGGGQTSFVSTTNKFDYNKPKIDIVLTKPQTTFGSFGSGVQKTTSQSTFGSVKPSVGISGGGQTSFVSTTNKFDYNKPKIDIVQTKPQSTFGSFGSGIQKTTSQTTFGSVKPSVGISGGGQTSFVSTTNNFDYNKPKVEIVQTIPQSTFGSFGSGVQKTTSQTTFGSVIPSVGISGGGQTSFVSTTNNFDYNKPKVEIVQTKPQSTFGSFGSGVQKTTSQTTFGSVKPSVGISGSGQTSYVSNVNKYDYSQPKIDIVQTKPQSTFGSFGSGVQKTTSQSTFGSIKPSVEISGGGQTSFVSTTNKFDYNKPKIDIVQTKPQSTFGSFGSGVQKTTSQTTFGSVKPSVGISGGGQTSFVSTTNNFDYKKPKVEIVQTKPQFTFGSVGSGVQKTTSQTTLGSVKPSVGFSGGGQTSFVSTTNKFDYNKPKIDIIQTKPQSTFGSFGSGVQKTNSQTTFGSLTPSIGIGGSAQTSFGSTASKFDYNKPKIDIVQTKPQSTFGSFGSGVQKTTSQTTFGSVKPSVGISGGGQTSFVSTTNKFDYNKPKIDIVLTKPQTTFGSFGSGVQKTTSQTTFGSVKPSVGVSGGGQTSFVSTTNKFDYNKPKIDIVLTKPQTTFGSFGSGVQKTTSQSTFGSVKPSVGISGGGQTSFVSTTSKFDYNKPKIDIVQTKPQSTFAGFGSGVQKTTSQTTFGSVKPSVGISGGGQTSFVSTTNKFDYNKPKIDIVLTKPQTTFGSFGSGVQKTTSQTTFGSVKPSVGVSGGGQTSFVSTTNKFDYNKPKIDIVLTKPQTTFGSFGSGVQKTTSQSTFGSVKPSVGISGGGQTSFVSTTSKFDYNKPKIDIVQTKPQSTFAGFGSGVQKTTSQTTFGSVKPSVGISGGGQTSFVSTTNNFGYNKPKIDIVQTKPQSTFGSFGSGVQKTTSQTTFGSVKPSVGISGGGQTSFVSTVNKYDYSQPKIDIVQTKPQSSFGSFGSGVQKTTSQSTFGSVKPSVGISGGGQTSFVSTASKFDYNKPKVDIVLTKPQSTFGSFGSGVQKTTSQTSFGSVTPSLGISGSGQTAFGSTASKFDYNKPKIDIVQPKPQSTFGSFGSGVQKTTSQTTFGSIKPSVGISGSGQTSFVSTASKFDYNKPKIDIVQVKPQTSFGSFGSGVQKTTSQTTFGSVTPSVGIRGSGQTSFVSTTNNFGYNKPKIDIVQTKPQSTFGGFGGEVQKTTSQTTFGSVKPSVGISGSGQTSFVSTVNKYDYSKPKIDIIQTKPQSTFGSFGSGVQKTTSQTTFGSVKPSVGISGNGQTSFVSTASKFDYNKPKIDIVQTKPQSTFGSFGSGVQKTTSQTTFGSVKPSVGISGGGQTSFVSTTNNFDYNKPKIDIVQTKPQSTFGSFGSGVQKTTSQTTFGSVKPSVGISGSSQTSFGSTASKFDFNKPKVDIIQTKPQSTFGSFGSGVQKTTSQTTFGSVKPSVGISGSGQSSFVSTASKFDYNKPKIEIVETKPQSTFGSFGSGVQKTTSQTTFGSVAPSIGITGGGQTSFVSTVNKFDYNKPKIDIVQTKPQSTFGSFGSGVQKTTSQSTFGSVTPSVGISGSGQTSFVSKVNKYDFNVPKIDLPKPTPKPVGQSSFGVFGTGGTAFNTQKTTSSFSSKFPSTGSGQTSVFSNVNKYEVNKPRVEFSTSKPTSGSSFGLFGGSSGSRFGSSASSSKVSGFDYSTQRPSTNAPEYLPPLGSTFQKVKYNDDIKYF